MPTSPFSFQASIFVGPARSAQTLANFRLAFHRIGIDNFDVGEPERFDLKPKEVSVGKDAKPLMPSRWNFQEAAIVPIFQVEVAVPMLRIFFRVKTPLIDENAVQGLFDFNLAATPSATEVKIAPPVILDAANDGKNFSEDGDIGSQRRRLGQDITAKPAALDGLSQAHAGRMVEPLIKFLQLAMEPA